ncbi:MAG: hypothetical protein WCP59_01505 [Actinomycetota bacterium]
MSATPVAPRATQAIVWLARLAWLLLAVVGGAGFGQALTTHSRAVQLVGTTVLWIGWAIVALALAVPSTMGLTAARTLTPTALVASIVAAIAADSAGTAAVVAVATSAVATACVLTGEFGQSFVQASAYGDEQRFLLRPPVAPGAAVAVAWVPLCAGLLTAPLLLAARDWVWGVLVAVPTVVLAWLGARSFHRLSRRWVVIVPAGLVVHDQVVLADTVMFRHAEIARIGLALADTGAADCTGPASGHAVEVQLHDSATLVYAPTRSTPNGRAIHATALLVAPTRPGRLLQAAGARGLPVG